jgi:hypothetical protein
MSDRRKSLVQWIRGAWFVAGFVALGLWPPLDVVPHLVVAALVVAMGAVRRAIVARRAGEPFYQDGWALAADGIDAGMLFFPVASFLVLGGNGLLDRSAPVEHPTSLVAKGWMGRRVEVKSWRPGETTVSLAVGRARYAKLTPGMPVTVVSRAGAFGWEWVEIAHWPQGL